MSPFPELPIVTPDPPRKSQSEKYGGLFYLGGAGLAILILLIAWFGFGVWSLRTVWRDIYLLNDPSQSEATRLASAMRLANDPEVTQRQKWDLALSRVPPSQARYILAESLDSELVDLDPRAYAVAVARSEDWPGWLRVLLTTPLAIAAGEGTRLDEASIQELGQNDDPMIKILCDFSLGVSPGITPKTRDAAIASLKDSRGTRYGEFVEALLKAMDAKQPARSDHLREAKLLIRTLHPEASALGMDRREMGVGPRE